MTREQWLDAHVEAVVDEAELNQREAQAYGYFVRYRGNTDDSIAHLASQLNISQKEAEQFIGQILSKVRELEGTAPYSIGRP